MCKLSRIFQEPGALVRRASLKELLNPLESRKQTRSVTSAGTSKWNKIEHRLFSFILQNWRGKPLVSHQAIVSLIAATTTRMGLRVKAAVDTSRYETAVNVPDEVFVG